MNLKDRAYADWVLNPFGGKVGSESVTTDRRHGNLIRLLFASATLALLLPGASARAEKPPKAGARAGVKTPGVQVPFANLIAEAEVALGAAPEWISFSEWLYAPSGDSIAAIDAKANKAGDPIAGLSKPCGGLVSAFQSLWSPQCGNGTLERIDPKTRKVTATIGSGVAQARGSIVASSDSIWLLTDDKTTLSRIDPDQNLVVAEMRLPSGCQSLTLAEKSLWIACPARNKVLRVNPATNVLEESIGVSEKPIALAAGVEGAVWALCRKDGKIDRIDARTNKVTKSIELGVPDADGAIAFGEGWLWVTQKGFPLTRVDTKQDAVAQQFYGAGGGGAIATSKGALWLSTASGVSRIDPKRVLATLPPE